MQIKGNLVHSLKESRSWRITERQRMEKNSTHAIKRLYNVVQVIGVPIKIPVLSGVSGIKCLGAVVFKTEEVNCLLDPNYQIYFG